MGDDDLSPPVDRYGHDLVDLYHRLLHVRLIEDKMLSLLRRGQLAKWFSGLGQEAVSVGVTAGLRDNDWILPGHRNLGIFTGRGVDPDRLFRQLLGRAKGFTQGRDRSFHFGVPDHHIVGMISHMGAMAPVAVGLALAARLHREPRVAVSLFGDGATSEGDVHEAMNLAAVWRLPVLFVVENNQWGLSTPAHQQYACAALADRAHGYGMPGERVDGNDVLVVRDAVRRAAAHARSGRGPVLLELLTYRMRGHEEASGTSYMPEAELAAWADRDPVERLATRLDREDVLDAAGRAELRTTLADTVEQQVAAALEAPFPTSDVAAELADVTAQPASSVLPVPRDPPPAPPDAPPGGPTLRYLDAITDGLRTALAADERVLLMGQDIAEYGGVFKVTAGLADEFGTHRVRNTPITESAVLGAALGLALDGFRPVVEMQFADFISCGFNQMVNNLATTFYRWGAPVPVVVRAPSGGGTGAGPFHSQNVEAHFAPVPGLRIVAPATPADAKGLLLAALDDNNPVLYLEHKALYRGCEGPVPEGPYTVPIGRGRVARPGRDATVVTYGAGVAWAVEAAEALASEDHEVEVVDLRSLRPWDRELVLDSVARTSRVLVLHEAARSFGLGAEIAATIADEAFTDLDAPVRRLGGLDTPIPSGRGLEGLWSARSRLLPTLRDLLAW